MRKILFFVLLILWLPFCAVAQGTEGSLNGLAQSLDQPQLQNYPHHKMILQVTNESTGLRDDFSRELETKLYSALQQAFPQFQLIFLDESLTGVNLAKSVIIQGKYRKKGSHVNLHLKALAGMKGQILSQGRAQIKATTTVRRSLVAVLDVEAKQLSDAERVYYSDLFREHLNKQGGFDLASSAEVSKMNPDAIQKSTGCTRDECATVIGQQLGVDLVISWSLFQIGKQTILSGKILDIQQGSIKQTATIKHRGAADEVEQAIKRLARKLTGSKGPTKSSEWGQVYIDSTPPDATIWLDGKQTGQQTPSLIKQVSAGEHNLRLIKGERGLVQGITVKPGALVKLTLELKNQAKIQVTSEPFGYEVFYQGQKRGNTPLGFSATTGWQTFSFGLPGGEKASVSRYVSIDGNNQLHFNLDQMGFVQVKLTPEGGQLYLDDQPIGKKGATQVPLLLGSGKYSLSYTHPGSNDKAQQEITVEPRVLKNPVSLTLNLTEPFLSRQTYQRALVHRSDQIFYGLSASAGFFLYSAYQASQAKSARSDQEQAEQAQGSVQTKTDWDTNKTKITGANQRIKKANLQTNTGLAFGLLGLGWAGWNWLDAPDPPGQSSWEFAPTTEGLTLGWRKPW